jgi:hypothetical protein
LVAVERLAGKDRSPDWQGDPCFAESELGGGWFVRNYPAGPNLYTIGWKRKINEVNDLDRRFSIAPMMDWSES